MEQQLLIEMAYALGIGVLIGLERTMGHGLGAREPDEEPASTDDPKPNATADSPTSDDSSDDADFLGIRTFSVLSLTGYSAALAGEHFSFLTPLIMAGVCALVVASYLRATHRGTGITTEAAAVTTAVLGVLCHTNAHAAGVLALILTVLLASKRFTHGMVSNMRRVELTDTLKFLVVILIVLPLLPNRALDPYGAFNPYKVGFLVVLISGISFVGYFLTRILGAQRGLGLTGILGGLTSSTAVTAAMSSEAKANPELRSICAFSTIAANATMFCRVLVVVAVLDTALVLRLSWSLGAMAVVATTASIILWIRAGRETRGGHRKRKVPLKNPFSVGPALKFAAFFVGILFVADFAKKYLGDEGLYAAAAASGLADVDAITLTIAEQTKISSVALNVGTIAITIAVVSNSVVKTIIAIYSGGWLFGRMIALCLGLATVAGLTVAFVM